MASDGSTYEDGTTDYDKMARLTARRFSVAARDVVREVAEKEEKAHRQKKKIGRIAQKAEAAQRLAKGGSWK
jgi:hypothetical protein